MKRRIIIILSIMLIVISIMGLYQTFATTSIVTNEDDRIYNITLNGDTTVNVPAKSSKTVFYQISNNNKGKVQYGVGYESDNITVKTYWDTIDTDSGIIDYGEKKFIKLKLINDSESDDTVILTTVLGYENGGDLIVPSGVTLISDAVSEKNEMVSSGTVSSSSNTFLDSGTVKRSEITEVTFEKDNIVPTNAISPKDISSEGDGSVMMWYTENSDGSYELHIGSENGKASITNGESLFSYLENVEVLDFTNVDLSGLTSMRDMFYGSTSLKEIRFGNSKLSNITDMDSAFYETEGLTTIDLSNFDTSNVTDMGNMFAYSAIEYLDLRSFDTSKVTDMKLMFYGCSNLKYVNLSSFNTSNVKNISQMFNGCSSLTTLDLSNFDTSKVTDMRYLFHKCSSLTTLDLSSFNTSNITNMAYMFSEMKNLTSLNVSSFNTSKVTDMSRMFSYCNSLTTLDLSSFDTSGVEDTQKMFGGCSSLSSINFKNAVFTNVTSYTDMFLNVPNSASVIVKDSTQKNWITSNFTNLTNVTVVN